MRKRLLVIAASGELYGSDRTLLAAMPRLAAAMDVTVAFPQDGPAVARHEALGVDTVVLRDFALRRRYLTPGAAPASAARMVGAVATLTARHRQRPFDLVYSNTLAASIGPALRGLWRVPHVVHVRERMEQPARYGRALLALVQASADLVLCNSEFTRTWVLAERPALAGRTVVVHNGIDLPSGEEVDDLVAARGAGRPEDAEAPLRITCPARIHPGKGQRTLLDAAALAAADGRQWRIDLFGDTLPEHAGLENELRRQADRDGIGTWLRWRGFESDRTVLYGDADVCAIPSLVPETFSLVAAEASVRALPVVVTGPSGAAEVIADGVTGIVFPRGDAKALYEALARLEDDADLRQLMGAAGRARVAERFGAERYAARIAELLEEASARRR